MTKPLYHSAKDLFKCDAKSPCKGANDNFNMDCEAAVILFNHPDFEYKPSRYLFCPYCGTMIDHNWAWINDRLRVMSDGSV